MVRETSQSPDLREAKPLSGKLVVITGTSRGIGAETARQFALAGADIVGTHVDPDPGKQKKQDKVEADCLEAGVNFTSILSDITTEEGRRVLLNAAIGSEDNPKKVDVLYLNAAGGLEEDKPDDWAETINISSQLDLVEEFLPHMARGGIIIYPASIWSHEYGNTKQMAQYEPVASTKHEAERRLRELIPYLDEINVKLGVLVGDVTQGTGAYTIFKLLFRDKLSEIEKTMPGGKFPTAEDMGKAVVDMALNPGESGFTKFVGRTELEPIDMTIFQSPIQRDEVARLLPMYNDETLFIDSFMPRDLHSGIAMYTVREQDVAGHFTGPYEDIKVEPGHILMEGALQALGLTYGTTHMFDDIVGFFDETSVKSSSFVLPGEQVRFETQIEKYNREGFVGRVDVFVGDKVVGALRNAKITIAPVEIARRLYRQEVSKREKAGKERKNQPFVLFPQILPDKPQI